MSRGTRRVDGDCVDHKSGGGIGRRARSLFSAQPFVLDHKSAAALDGPRFAGEAPALHWTTGATFVQRAPQSYSSEPCTQMKDCRSIMSFGLRSRLSRRTISANSRRLAYVSQFGLERYRNS